MALGGVLLLACGSESNGSLEELPPRGPRETGQTSETQVRPDRIENELTRGDTIPGRPAWTAQDWAVLEETLRWAYGAGVADLPIGERVARIGERYLGTAYVPRTLDPPGPERLVVNLRGLDCVTYVEGMLTIARLVKAAPASTLADSGATMELYENILTSLRYRDGLMGGYPSRLHYFSEWIHDNTRRGHLLDVTAELGGEVDPEPLSFMTSHREAYHQLADETALRAVQGVEDRLRGVTRYVIPQERLTGVQSGIRTGDIIAAASTLEGLDVAHTGIAVWRGDVLHLMHAPLVGEAVQLSERSLAERLLGIASQDGVLVARPLEVEAPSSEGGSNEN